VPEVRALIVDDEPPARDRLRDLLADDDRIEVVAEAGDGVEAVRLVEELDPDLVFLDIQMPELDGFQVLEELDPELRPRIVFVTAYDEFAVKAFEVNAVDYLLKPVDRERFRAAVDRALVPPVDRGPSIGGNRAGGEDVREVLRSLRERRPLERFLVRERSRLFLVPVEEVDWIGAAGNYVELHAGGEVHLVRGTMKELERRLDATEFARIHRSTIVRLDRIEEMHPWSHGDHLVVLTDGTELRMSRRYRHGLEGVFGG